MRTVTSGGMRWRKLLHGPLPLLLLFFCASLLYNISYPIMEGSDEPFHYGYIEQLRRGEGFPDPTIAPQNLAQYESSQAPLYYVTSAAILKLVPGIPEWDGAVKLNNWFGAKPVHDPDNKNIFLHNFASPQERFTGVARGVRIARLVSTFFASLTVLAAYLITREIASESRWLPLAAGALIAFNPQFIQISAVVENDAAASAFVGLLLWQLVITINRQPARLRHYALAGLFGGFAIISKSSALIVLPLAAFALLLNIWQDRPAIRWRIWLARAAVLLGIMALSGGWWYLRNWLLYADPMRGVAYEQYPWQFPELRPLTALLPDLPRSLLSFWADLGYSGDIRPTWVFYTGAWLIVIGALLGLLRFAIERKNQHANHQQQGAALLLVSASALLSIAMYVRLQQNFSFAWGRHLLPSAAAYGVLFACGLYHLFRRYARPALQLATAFLVMYAFLIPPLHLLRSYLPPRVTSLPAEVSVSGWQYGDIVRLAGYNIEQRTLQNGGDTVVLMCWETLAQPELDYAFALHIVDKDGNAIGRRDSYHGLGRYPSSAWRAGDLFCDRVRVPLAGELSSGELFNMRVSVYDPETIEDLPVTLPDGAPAPTFVDWFKTASVAEIPPDAIRLDQPVRFGDAIYLAAYQINTSGDDGINVTLYWETQTPITDSCTVFIHIVDEQSELIAQSDALPRQGRYPTWAWDAGETIVDAHTLHLAGGQLSSSIYVGMYHSDTIERLPVTVDGEPAGSAFCLSCLDS